MTDHYVPENIRGAIDRYVRHGLPPGDCTRAILANDLQEAFARADRSTIEAMPAIVLYVFANVPFRARGSHAAVDKWLALSDEKRARETGRSELAQ